MNLPLRARVALIAALVLVLPLGCAQEKPAPSSPPQPSEPVATATAQPAQQAAPTAPASAEPAPAPEPAKHANRLAKETSPYLLLHAHNPVDWYPWGQEALDKAKRENKLIFLSIGYSSCYWCHVMERKCFMDPQIAAYLNEHFVAIKVDREERPDLDDIYMTALQIYYANTGSPQAGGWPLSMFLTPQAQPLMGGTYFPPEQFTEVLERVQDRWQNDRQSLTTLGEKFAEIVATHMKGRVPLEPVALEAARLNDIQTALAEQFDPEYGGFGYSEADAERPKFPDASNLLFLLARARGGDEAASKMLRLSLDRMAAGGIRDHLGGGFHRYSTDRYWRVPHFEKMLYDQGQLASVYAQGYALTKDLAWKQAGEATCDYVLREFTAPSGGFTSALDAETDGKEGAYYAWTAEEAKQVLTPEEYELAAEVYGLNGTPNFEEAFVLLEAKPLAQIAQARGKTVEELQAALAPVRAKLLAARNERKRPLVDTKILTAWNGLMIRGLAEAGKTFENPKYTDAAARAANVVLDSLKATGGRLLRIPGGDPALKGYLEDYAYFIDGLLALHQATGDPRWLEAAEKLQAKQDELFWDAERGGYFFTSSDHEQLIARVKNPVDSATPSGNAVSAGNLVYLAKAAGKPEYRERAGKIFAAFGPQLQETPSAVPRLGLALGEWLASQTPSQ